MAQVQSLVMELRSHNPHSTAEKEEKEKLETGYRENARQSNHEESRKAAGFQAGHQMPGCPLPSESRPQCDQM